MIARKNLNRTVVIDSIYLTENGKIYGTLLLIGVDLILRVIFALLSLPEKKT